MSHLFAPQWATVTTSSLPFTQHKKPHNLPGVSQSPTASNWSKIRRGPQVVCSGAYQSVHTAEPEGDPIKKPLIKGGSALNKTWTGTAFLHHICRDLGLLGGWCKLSWKYSLWSLCCFHSTNLSRITFWLYLHNWSVSVFIVRHFVDLIFSV